MPYYLSNSYLFRCDNCRFVTDNKKDYRRHVETAKHKKLTQTPKANHKYPQSEHVTQPDVNKQNSIWKPQSSTLLTNVQHAFIFDKRIYKYCEKCGQKYCSKSGLWKHRKTCDGSGFIPDIPEIQTTSVSPTIAPVAASTDQDLKIMMFDMLKNNQEFQNKLIEMICSQQSLSLTAATNAANAANAAATAATAATAAATAATAAATVSVNASSVPTNSNSNNYTGTTNSHNNNNNNTFNLQFFLNEQCKDAMNITDFASSINLKVSDLDNFGRMGYVQGMSKLFIDSLRETEVCKRPIHCSDSRRETLYVKDADKWEREDSQYTKIANAVRVVEHKNIVLVNEWAKQNPRCEDSSTKENSQYINMSRAVLDGDDKNIAKVIKLVAKEVVIEK
jgi:uncharacterized C2H2 Zn-finger protein